MKYLQDITKNYLGKNRILFGEKSRLINLAINGNCFKKINENDFLKKNFRIFTSFAKNSIFYDIDEKSIKELNLLMNSSFFQNINSIVIGNSILFDKFNKEKNHISIQFNPRKNNYLKLMRDDLIIVD